MSAIENERVYLPPVENGIDTLEYLKRYVSREFLSDNGGVHCVPRAFRKSEAGEKQASLAEEAVFTRLRDLSVAEKNGPLEGLWVTFFHSASYAGHSRRNQRVGKLMIREHDFVLFAKFQGKYYTVLIEVKSTNDQNTTKDNIEKTSDAKVIKNNKRSAQHQLRDHLEMLENILGVESPTNTVQSYIMWPFLGAFTKDPRQQTIKRWKEDRNLHVFENTIAAQAEFDDWFYREVLQGASMSEEDFAKLLNRYVVLSCGVYVDEIHRGMLALLTQEQLQLLQSDVCCVQNKGPIIVHGAAGTGKTLLVLRKLQQLHQTGRLDEHNRALYVCYWPGIRCDMEMKFKALGIDKYIDTCRFFISMDEFLAGNDQPYRHVFMDESEALCLSFSSDIIRNTMAKIYRKYHAGNCTIGDCSEGDLRDGEDVKVKISHHRKMSGEIWFMVDINQAHIFLPKLSPPVLKTPDIVLSKVMRSTRHVFEVFKYFYNKPMPNLPESVKSKIHIPNITMGHDICGPPVYWVEARATNIEQSISNVVIDLCATKGFKPNNICVLPFIVSEKMTPDVVNSCIEERFVEKGYRPKAVKDVEAFLEEKELNNFLITWALRVKGLEFKVVIFPIEEDDFELRETEDRKKAYIIASRCTCMLILVCDRKVKNEFDAVCTMAPFPFSLNLNALIGE